MRQHVFKDERATVDAARAKLSRGSITPGDYEELLDAYERLLGHSEKIVRIGDATQNKLLRAQKMLHRAIQRYKATAEQKTELLSIVTHDLKNKAAPIRDLTRWVIAEVQDSASARAVEMLRHIYEAAEKITHNVTETLNRESARSSDIVPVFEWTDLVRLTQRVIEDQTPYAREKEIELKLTGPRQCEACVDEFLIGEVFENLINNAIKFSPRRSQVAIALHCSEDGVTLRVKDNGPGLIDEDKLRLFGRFQTLSARPTGGESSTGMGLFIVRKLVDLHSGEVTAESDGPGTGATFTVKLPPQIDPPGMAT